MNQKNNSAIPSPALSYHTPVMLNECIDGLRIIPDGVYVDATFGGGGHSRAILQHLGPEGRLFAFDRDSDALNNTINDPRFCLINENFAHLRNFVRLHGVRRIDGLLADLGISSHQIDTADRGFSTRFDGPLDLRMDRREGVSAATLVNSVDEDDLARILKLYGELPNARQLAHCIVAARKNTPIETTAQLRAAVEKHLPRNRSNKYLAMIFQALRIETNGELEALRLLLSQASEMLNDYGRLCVISYHSLEDRLVKNFFKAGNFEGTIHKDFFGNPIVPLHPVQHGSLTASDNELQDNNRARSARLRIAEKLPTNQDTNTNKH